MRPVIFSLFLLIAFSGIAQKSEVQLEPEGKVEGQITTKFSKKGCGTLITINSGGKKIYLMPKAPLDKEFDKNKLRIKLTYRRLRMPSPPNCEFCYMVDIKEIEKK